MQFNQLEQIFLWNSHSWDLGMSISNLVEHEQRQSEQKLLKQQRSEQTSMSSI